jgi:hypothetical protein
LSGEFILINKAKQEQEKASEGKIGKSHAHKKEKKYCEGAEKSDSRGRKTFSSRRLRFFLLYIGSISSAAAAESTRRCREGV